MTFATRFQPGDRVLARRALRGWLPATVRTVEPWDDEGWYTVSFADEPNAIRIAGTMVKAAEQ